MSRFLLVCLGGAVDTGDRVDILAVGPDGADAASVLGGGSISVGRGGG